MDPRHSHGPDRIDYKETGDDLTAVHAALKREHPEPTAEVTPIPVWLTAVCGVAICWAGVYLGLFHGGFRGDIFNERLSSPELLFPQAAKSGGAAAVAAEPTLAEQGKAVFQTCQTCHMPTGLGQPGVIPPLAGSEFVLGSEKRVVAIVLKGLTGPVTVKGNHFANQMQAWEGALSDKKIAAVLTFVRSNWGNNAPEITPAKVAFERKELADHKAQMTEPEVLAIPTDATLPDPGAAPAPAGTPPAGGAPAPAPAATAPSTTTPAPVAAPSALAPAPAAPSASAAPAPAAPAPAPAAGPEPTPEILAAGKAVYMTVCFVCHQPTGLGIPMVFPPLAKSPYVNGTPERFIAMILKGNMGAMSIDGKPFNNIMPPQEALLTDEKVAAVATYVRNSFENHASAVTKEEVETVRKKFADRKTSWTQAELDAWKD